ncbi:chemosensory receptor C [Elysia marginata]|uniref:Chemosensory receptor C n=1 Tax=Elysia marginata TaxID=1093978 RepID=A0AAV4HAU7_9GAST|nr:chemosensory receptor C [Elysia marginata]
MAAVLYRIDKLLGLINPDWSDNWKLMTWVYLVYLPIFAGYVSYAMATYVSIERCLCVSIPFKVKSLITPQLTAGFMTVLSVIVLGSFSPMFFIYTVEYTYNPINNLTVPRVALNDLYYARGQFIPNMYKFLGIFYPAIFCTIMISTSAIIVFHLKKSVENLDRGENAKTSITPTDGVNGRVSTNLTSREVKVTKMLLVVIFVYLMDFFPRLCKYVASFFEPEFFTYRKYHNLWIVMSILFWVLDFINASVNFFIFIGMSSNFRKTFYVIYPRCKPSGKGKH